MPCVSIALALLTACATPVLCQSDLHDDGGEDGQHERDRGGGHKQSRVPGGGQHQRFEQQPQQPSWASPQAWPVSAQAANPGSRLRP